jgi:hypothetical protein
MEFAINRACWNALVDRNYGVIRNSAVTKKERIQADLNKPVIARETRPDGTVRENTIPLVVAIASKQLKRTGQYKPLKRKRRGPALPVSRWNKAVSKRAKAITGKRIGSIGYAGAGWADAAAALAPVMAAQGKTIVPKPPGRRGKRRNKLGHATGATQRKLEAVAQHFGNTVLEVPRSVADLNRALVAAARDMRTYAEKRMQEDARKHSGR